MTDLEWKKRFLQQGSDLYREMIELTDHDVIKRYLAFRIIVNAMSFEDLIGHRCHPTMRKIRNTLLAHKQEPDFFVAFDAVDHITRSSVGNLLRFMQTQTHSFDPQLMPLEMTDEAVNRRFKTVVGSVLDDYAQQEIVGFRLTNNFLSHTGSQIHEISNNDLAGVFYRYNSSKALHRLSEWIFNNTRNCADFTVSTRHAKLDMILHAQNMADCAIRDTRNQHSIDGLLEVCLDEPIGDATPLADLKSDPTLQRRYRCVREVRNGVIGHIDTSRSLADLLAALDRLSIDDVWDLVNSVDKAVWEVSRTHVAISGRYGSANQPLNDPNIVDIPGFKSKPYDG